MSDKNQHSDRHSQFFEHTNIPYSRSKEDVWEAMMNQQKPEIKQPRKTRKMLIYWSAAAMLIVLLGLTSFMRFYSVTLYAPKGQHLSKLLPDSSRVHLNAQTQISYYPYWWRFARLVELDGEAFFDVRKGSNFAVNSEMGTTTVLGTRFNIFARNKQYRVQCISGQVEVKDNTGQKQILKPDQAVIVFNEGNLKYIEKGGAKHAISWTKNRFVFTAVPIKEVFKEMERQFNLQIEVAEAINGTYTGNFKRGSNPESILRLIARPFGLEIEKTDTKKYRIRKSEN